MKTKDKKENKRFFSLADKLFTCLLWFYFHIFVSTTVTSKIIQRLFCDLFLCSNPLMYRRHSIKTYWLKCNSPSNYKLTSDQYRILSNGQVTQCINNFTHSSTQLIQHIYSFNQIMCDQKYPRNEPELAVMISTYLALANKHLVLVLLQKLKI